jgi:quercetin dioxygenase-like cupin family protein
MLIRHSDSVTGHEVDTEGAKGVIFRMLLGEGEGAPNFCMRQFNIAAGGHTPRDSHDWEHELYVLSGSGVAVTNEGEEPIGVGDCILVAPQQEHQFRNAGAEELRLLCLVPRTDT